MSLVLKNGVVVGSANISVLIGGVIVTGIRSIDFGYSQKKENIHGLGSEPVARGRGAKEYPNPMIEILLEEYKNIVAAAPNGDITQISLFNIPIVYDNNILPSETLNNCEFVGRKSTNKAGDTASWVTVELIYAGLNQ